MRKDELSKTIDISIVNACARVDGLLIRPMEEVEEVELSVKVINALANLISARAEYEQAEQI